MKRVLLFMVLLLGLAVAVTPVQASIVKFDLGSCFPGSVSPNPSDSPPWLIAVFEDGDAPGTVKLTLSADFATGELVSWYLNLDPTFNPASLIFDLDSAHTTSPFPTISKGVDAYNLGGDGFYDIEFRWCSGWSSFDGGEFITYTIKSTDPIVASSFDFFSTRDGEEPQRLTAACILDNESMHWFGASTCTSVPIPGVVWLLGSGLLGLAGLRKKIKK